MTPSSVGRVLLVVAALVVLAAVSAGVWVMGSPSAQREARLDARRESDLVAIRNAVVEYWAQHAALPGDLATLAARPGLRLAIVDPADGTPYVYQVTGSHDYRLCAVFTTDTAESRHPRFDTPGESWLHGRGRHCFDRKVSKKKDD